MLNNIRGRLIQQQSLRYNYYQCLNLYPYRSSSSSNKRISHQAEERAAPLRTSTSTSTSTCIRTSVRTIISANTSVIRIDRTAKPLGSYTFNFNFNFSCFKSCTFFTHNKNCNFNSSNNNSSNKIMSNNKAQEDGVQSNGSGSGGGGGGGDNTSIIVSNCDAITSTEKPSTEASNHDDNDDDTSKHHKDNNHNNNNNGNNNNNNKNKKRKRKSNRWAWTKKWKEKRQNKKNSVGDTEGGEELVEGEDNNNNSNNNNKNVRKKNSLTWTTNPKEVNEGSFACKNMQTKYNVQVDDHGNDDGNDDVDISNENGNENEDEEQQQQEETGNKLPKRKVALFIGFLGTNYTGFQMNKDQRTLQAEIELALYKAKLISRSNFGFPNKYSWSSSARTDKGVHSCAQVCSVKILIPNDDMDVVREMINKELPDDIVILDVVRVARSYVAKTARDKVRYQYMLPSFLLQDYALTQQNLRSIAGEHDDHDKDKDVGKKPLKEWNQLTSDEVISIRESFKTYRVSEDTLQKLKDTLGRFSGTHKFHNYTSKKDSQDDSARRYIHSFVVVDKVVDEYGMEWIATNVVGQSFLLHQIRKMMSMAIDITRGAVSSVTTAEDKNDIDVMEESFSPQYMTINVAPAQGLFLDMSFFDNYNKRALGKGEALDWHSEPESEAVIRWKNFKEQKVMKHVMAEEAQQHNFIKYMFIQEFHLKYASYESSEQKVHTNYNANRK